MPLSKLQFRPGINKEGTNYTNEGGYYACDKMRFRSGTPEKIGGWVNQSFSNTYSGTARSLLNWVTYDGYNLLALGTNQKYYIEQGGAYNDITPLNGDVVTLGASPISTTSGSKVVTISATGHGAAPGTFVEITTTSTVGGLTISGEYEIVTTPDSDSFTIASPTAASSTTTGGGTVTVQYQINAGNSVVTSGSGWGVGVWGGVTGEASTGWGMGGAGSVALPLRLWAQDNFEQDLIFAEVGGNIYYWPKDTVSYARAQALETYADTLPSGVVVETTATSNAGTTNLYVDTTDGIYTGSILTHANLAAGTYVADNWDYSLTIPLDNDTVAASSIITSNIVSGQTITVNYAGRHIPSQTNFIIASDTSHFTIALGAQPYDPTDFNPPYDPMLVRWSDQDDPFQWVPQATNQAGEQHLSNGSYLVTAQNNRQEILVWSDSALYSMQYLGPPYVWGFNLIGDNTSIASPNAVITVNTVAYWMGVDKFYIYNGRLETLSCSLWKYVYDNLNRDQINQVVCGSNEGFSEIWWHYPSENSDVNDSYIIFNYLENTWYYGTMNRTAWLDSPLRNYPMAAFSVQQSYLSNDIDETVTSIPIVNGSSYPSSGTVLIELEQISYTSISGNNLNGCTRGVNGTSIATHKAYTPVQYTVANQVMFHENGNDDNSTTETASIYAWLESSDFDIGDGNNFGFITRVIPDITFRGSSADNPSVMLTFLSRTNTTSSAVQTSGPGSAYETKTTNPTSVTRSSSSPVEQYTSQVFTRVRGRQAAFRVESDGIGVAWQVGAMRIDVRQDGRR